MASLSTGGGGGEGVPEGTVTVWSGTLSDIPDGWLLCDGNNGTPDLTDRFVVGAGGGYSVDGRGGAEAHALSTSEMPSHNHGQNVDTSGNTGTHDPPASGAADADRTEGVTTTTGGDSAHENRPPYHALAYIQKA